MKAFGHAWRDEWMLDPAITYLNHGTVGAPPRRILAEQQRLRDLIERQPSRFLLRELAAIRVGEPSPEPSRLRRAASAVGEFVGARGEDIVFVDNTTTGVNAILRSFDFAPGDEILISDHVYGAVGLAARYAARRAGATVRVVELPVEPTPERVLAALEAALGERTRIAILDHITSDSALVLPVAQMVRLCRARGVAALVDGAHAPGSIALDIPALEADWYVGNLHKWAWAPRSTALVWTAPERQPALHPTVISFGLDQGYTTEFDWMGTSDPTPHLAAPAALAMLAEVGFERVLAWNHELIWTGAHRLAERWRTRFEVPEEMIANMATIPLPRQLGATEVEARRLRDRLLEDDAIEVHVSARRGRLWTRVAAQIYNQSEDLDRLGAAVERAAAEAGRGGAAPEGAR